MPNIPVDLSYGITPLFFTEGDHFPNLVVVHPAHIQQTATHILRELQKKFGTHKVRALRGEEPPYPNDGIVASTPHRVVRHSNAFAASFRDAIGKIVEELLLADPGDGVLVLETSYNAETNFAGRENMWADFVYVFARLIKKKA